MAPAVAGFVQAHAALCRHYASTRLTFTLDGKLVGDLAEAIAAELFGLSLCERRTSGIDAYAADGRSVQVKATGLARKGPAFTPGEGFADHLIFLRFDFAKGTGAILYNGPEAPIRKHLPAGFTGTKRVSLALTLAADSALADTDRLLRIT